MLASSATDTIDVSAGEGNPGQVTKNRRYEAYYDELNDRKIAEAATRPQPVTLPTPAYGPERIYWEQGALPSVWAWIQWDRGPATRIAARAKGWNDRIVIVEWDGPGGFRDTVVWRQAVRRRTTSG